MTRSAVSVTAVVALALTLSVAGCSVEVGRVSQVSSSQLVTKVTSELTALVGRAPDLVECPDTLKATVGAATRCTLTDGGVAYGVSVTVKDVSGTKVNVEVEVDKAPLAASTGS